MRQFNHLIEFPSSQTGQSIVGFLHRYCEIPRSLIFKLIKKKQVFYLNGVKWSKINSLLSNKNTSSNSSKTPGYDFNEESPIVSTKVCIDAIGIKPDIGIDFKNILSRKDNHRIDEKWIEEHFLFENSQFIAISKPSGLSLHDGYNCIESSKPTRESHSFRNRRLENYS